MLTVQYRMHPEIRKFPSKFFYEGESESVSREHWWNFFQKKKDKLVDGENISTPLYKQPYHKDEKLGPYKFFNLKSSESSIKGE